MLSFCLSDSDFVLLSQTWESGPEQDTKRIRIINPSPRTLRTEAHSLGDGSKPVQEVLSTLRDTFHSFKKGAAKLNCTLNLCHGMLFEQCTAYFVIIDAVCTWSRR